MITRRAVLLLLTVFFRHAATAAFCLTFPGDLADSPSFRVIRAVAPLRVWALISLLVAVIVFCGVAFHREVCCRIGLALSAALTGSWIAGFMVAIWEYGIPPSPLLPIFGVSLLAKDLIISSGPLTRAAILKAYV